MRVLLKDTPFLSKNLYIRDLEHVVSVTCDSGKYVVDVEVAEGSATKSVRCPEEDGKKLLAKLKGTTLSPRVEDDEGTLEGDMRLIEEIAQRRFSDPAQSEMWVESAINAF